MIKSILLPRFICCPLVLITASCIRGNLVKQIPDKLCGPKSKYCVISRKDTFEIVPVKHGEYHGRYKMYIQGQMRVKGQYKNGKKDGVWYYITEDGLIGKEEEYDNGDRIFLSVPNLVW